VVEIANKQKEKFSSVQDENAYLRSRVEDLSSLIEVSIIINSTLDLDDLIELVMEKAQTVMKAEASSVMLINEEKNILEIPVALGEVGEKMKNKIELDIGEGIAGWVASHGQPLIVPDVTVDPRFSAKSDHTTGFQTRSILAAPLKVRDKVIGVAEVINRVDGKAFDDEDLDLFLTFCRQVAMAIDSAQMHQFMLEKQKLEQELESAKIIQQSFMPETFPDEPGQPFSIFAKSLPAKSVGGDFFDFIRFDDELIGVAVGDVTGKGVPAALYMARLVSDFRSLAQKFADPDKVLISLNELLVERSRRGMFVTFQYGILNAADGIFTFANAGHIPFIRSRPGRRHPELLEGGKSIPLGIAPEFSLVQESIQLDNGDAIVLVTDGIIEAKNNVGEIFSLKRTLEELSKPHGPAESIVNPLVEEVQSFTGDAVQHDDLTILALKLN